MPIRFECSSCQARIKMPDRTQGRKAKCPRCGFIQRVPDSRPTAASPTKDDVDESPSATSVAPPPEAIEQPDNQENDTASALAASAGDVEPSHEVTESDAVDSLDGGARDTGDHADEQVDEQSDDEAGGLRFEDDKPASYESDEPGDDDVYDKLLPDREDPSDSSAIDDLVSLGTPPTVDEPNELAESVAASSDLSDDEPEESPDGDALDEPGDIEEVDDGDEADDAAGGDMLTVAPTAASRPAPESISLSSENRQADTTERVDAPASTRITIPPATPRPPVATPPRSTSRAPGYRSMTVAGWVLRILAAGLSMSVVAERFTGSPFDLKALSLLIASLGFAALMWGIGEVVLGIRDVARNSFRS